MKKNAAKKCIALVGATGNVGRKILEILKQRSLGGPSTELLLYASHRSAGKKLNINAQEYVIHDLKEHEFEKCALTIFATDSDISKQYVPKALDAGSTVIDTSAAYRLEAHIPLIVPPVNKQLITTAHPLFSVANCIASPSAIVLHALSQYAPIHTVLISTYQSTSGAGKNAMDELYEQTKSIQGETYACSKQTFDRQIAFNVIPQIDYLTHDGFSYEESKIMQEIPKILGYGFHIAVTAVRVPVMVGHSMSLFLEFNDPVDLSAIQTILSQHRHIQYCFDRYITPIDVTGQDDVFVSRLRKHPTNARGLLLWITSDNLRRGAAVDVIEIAEVIYRL